MTDTSPGEIARIKASTDEQRWIEALTGIATLRERSEAHTQWMKDHDRMDNARFEAGEARMEKIEEGLGGARSGINKIQLNSRYTLKETVTGFLILCGALGGFIGFLYWLLNDAGKGAP